MNAEFYEKFPHLNFQYDWKIDNNTSYLFGKCEELVKVISNTPILPEHYEKLKLVSFKKGARATTAIEGNTLTEADIDNLMKSDKIPASKEYQILEVTNIIDKFNELVDDVIIRDKSERITPELIKEFHRSIGKNLGNDFKAIPGRFAQSNRVVGSYKCPDNIYIEQLVNEFCNWSFEKFQYFQNSKEYTFLNAFIHSIATHLYIEWIHPFDDGNGRTGRMLEFFILLRGGVPDIASHILSNYYNDTRSEYYRQIDLARNNSNLTSFIKYALIGFYEGLEQILITIHKGQKQVIWQKYIYDEFSDMQMSKRVKERKRALLMYIGIEEEFIAQDLMSIHPKISAAYANENLRTMQRDIDELFSNNFLKKLPGNFYMINDSILKGYLPIKKSR